MKLTVKTLKGTHFDIQVQPSDTVMAVKKNIEAVQGKDQYPWGQQLLIHSGKVLKDETTLEENKVSDDGFLVVMLSKSKTPATTGASSGPQSKTPATIGGSSAPQPAGTVVAPSTPSEAPSQTPASENIGGAGRETEVPAHDQAASGLVSGDNTEAMVQQLMDMGGGSWDKDTVQRALRAAYNNPERAVDYLYSGIPTTVAAEAQVPVSAGIAAANANATGVPNSAPLNLFPQVTPGLVGTGAGAGSLDFLRNNQQFQALRAMVQANPQILQPMLQELSKQNPQLLGLIQDHHAEFLQLINEPVEGLEGDLFDQSDQEMAHAISVTPAEQEAIERLEAMGFDREHVIEAFLLCDKNEQLAANYLLEHAGDED